MKTIAEREIGTVLTVWFYLVSAIAAFDLVVCGYLGLHYYATIPRFAAIWLLVVAVGVTVSWYNYLEAFRKGVVSREAQDTVSRLFMTIGFLLIAIATILKS